MVVGMSLHIYKSSINEFYAAESVQHAADLALKFLSNECGLSREEMDLDFVELNDAESMTLCDEDDGTLETKTNAEWAAHNGPGFFTAVDY